MAALDLLRHTDFTSTSSRVKFGDAGLIAECQFPKLDVAGSNPVSAPCFQ